MGVNKVCYGAVSIIDISDSTVTSDKLAKGVTAYDKAGEKITGTMEAAAAPVLQEKTVTPGTAAQEGTADPEDDGLSTVHVGAMPTATQATPSITVSSGGLITASATQSAGYVSAGTKSSTKQLTTQAAKTVTPGTADQTAVASGMYTTGDVTVKGDANLVAGNIKSGVSIFGVAGSYEGSGGSGGGSGGGFSVSFPAVGSTNYARWSNLDIAYILKTDGSKIDMLDYTSVAGKTIENVILFTAGGGDGIGLTFNFYGDLISYRPHMEDILPNLTAILKSNTTFTSAYGSNIHTDQFIFPTSNLNITSISACSTD